MEREKIYVELQKIFHRVFSGIDLTFNETLQSNDILEWDSLKHLELILEIEEVFGVKFGIREVLEMQTSKEMINILEKKLNE